MTNIPTKNIFSSLEIQEQQRTDNNVEEHTSGEVSQQNQQKKGLIIAHLAQKETT